MTDAERQELTAADFPAFFRALRNGQADPFPWQIRLVDELLAPMAAGGRDGTWPTLLDLPTGSGKTSTLEIALFVLALRHDAPRRIVFIVDRRVVVQHAAEWSTAIARKLSDSGLADTGVTDPVLATVAERLRAKSGTVAGVPGAPPLIASELRGGIEIDNTWAQRPDVPAVITATVDQVGSRLLMQGYGVSEGMKPVHAGLFANDALLLLDEVHLSQPFAETLAAIGRHRSRGRWWGADRWQVVQLSATPSRSAATTNPAARFSLTPDDRAGALAQRLGAHKPVGVVSIAARGDSLVESRQIAGELVRQAEQVEKQPAAKVIGVVANRVSTATEAARLLSTKFGAGGVVLLTGRMRPFDREQTLDAYRDRIRAGRDRRTDHGVLFVVGTQSIEAGADFDFDALVSECASLDALTQRFGRVDRLGEVSAGGTPCTSVIVVAQRSAKAPEDPIYGPSLRATAAWLTTQPALDFGLDHLAVDPDQAALMCVEHGHAPQLFSSHLDRWAQSPPPDATPDVALWLHGDRPTDTDVQVVWRNGVFDAGHTDELFVVNMIQALPPRAAESVTVPRSQVIAWLERRTPPTFGDVEGAEPAPDNPRSTVTDRRTFAIYRGDSVIAPQGITADRDGRASASPASSWMSPATSSIRPGDTIIVAADEGGLTQGTWDATADEPVHDLAVLVARDHRSGETVSRLSVAATRMPVTNPWRTALPDPLQFLDDPTDEVTTIQEWIRSLPEVDDTEQQSVNDDFECLRQLTPGSVSGGRLTRIQGRSISAYVIRIPALRRGRDRFSPEEATSTSTGSAYSLDHHLLDTADWAAAFADACGLVDSVAADVTAAAKWHDIGKADRRFQLLLSEGRISADRGPAGTGLLAKSAIPYQDRTRSERAFRMSGYPRGERHEMFSAAMLAATPPDDLTDQELVRHLVASHHGHGRPFAPVRAIALDGEPPTQDVVILGTDFVVAPHRMDSLASDVPTLFWKSIREHGWFSDAWLTALARLADHTASRFPIRTSGAPDES